MTYFENIKDYVGFSSVDGHYLHQLAEVAEPVYQRFADHFYECITRHPDADTVLEGPGQVKRLKQTLIDWMRTGLKGPHDEEFYQRRCRIGRVHVRIALPQQYMFTAMNVLRLDFHQFIREQCGGEVDRERATHDALDKLFDLELAIMLQTYREDSEDRMRRSERLATIGQIAASIGHDLRNPLSVMQSSLYILRKRAGYDERVGRHLDRIDVQIENCESIISNLLELARNQPPRRDPVDFEMIYRQAVQDLAPPPNLSLHFSAEPGLALNADAALLRQALINLLSNAVQAFGDLAGDIWVSATSEASQVIIEVADNGPGFDAETIARVFEPLVTTRQTGTGLGLALVKGVTERHGGTVEALNRADGGAAVRMRIPNYHGGTIS